MLDEWKTKLYMTFDIHQGLMFINSCFTLSRFEDKQIYTGNSKHCVNQVINSIKMH